MYGMGRGVKRAGKGRKGAAQGKRGAGKRSTGAVGAQGMGVQRRGTGKKKCRKGGAQRRREAQGSRDAQRVPAAHHGRARLDEPVESELRRLADGGAQLVEDVLAVEAEPVQHADEEAVLLLRVVLALVGAILQAQLVEGRAVPAHLSHTTAGLRQRRSDASTPG